MLLNLKYFLASVILVLGTFVGGLIAPLSAAHWDSPIYLYQAKRFADTKLLASYSRHANEIANQVIDRSWPKTQTYSESFWRFMRLGNITILGSIVKLSGNQTMAINLAGWVYAFFLSVATSLVFLAVCDLIALFETPNYKAITIAAASSAALYLLSPIFWYLSANFLSEIPALFLLSAALFAFLRGVLKDSAGFAVLTGVLLFLLYAVRMDSAWSAISVIVPLIIAIRLRAPHHHSYTVLIISVLTALLLFLVYSLIFFPLTDPRLVLALQQTLAESRKPSAPGYHAVFAAGGLLWIGATWAVFSKRTLPIATLGFVTLILMLLPRAGSLLSGPIHSRMFADLMIPLMFLSSAGLYFLLLNGASVGIKKASRALTFSALVVVLLVSLPLSYKWLRSIPGFWRLQYVRAFLAPPKYEQNNYKISDLSKIASAIYLHKQHTAVLWDHKIPQEYLNIVRFFGPEYPASTDLSMVPDPTDRRNCDSASLSNDWLVEPAIFCSDIEMGFLEQAASNGVQLLALEPKAKTDRSNSVQSYPGYKHEVIVENKLLQIVALRRNN